MTRYSLEEIAVGARALTDHIYGPGAWEKCAPDVQQINCQAFAAGVTTLPDHTAELVEALSVFLDDPAIQVSLGGNPVYADQRLAFAHEVYKTARAQTKGGDHA